MNNKLEKRNPWIIDMMTLVTFDCRVRYLQDAGTVWLPGMGVAEIIVDYMHDE